MVSYLSIFDLRKSYLLDSSSVSLIPISFLAAKSLYSNCKDLSFCSNLEYSEAAFAILCCSFFSKALNLSTAFSLACCSCISLTLAFSVSVLPVCLVFIMFFSICSKRDWASASFFGYRLKSY